VDGGQVRRLTYRGDRFATVRGWIGGETPDSLSPADSLHGTVRRNPRLRLVPSPSGISAQDVIAALTEQATQAQLRDGEVNELLSVVQSTDSAHDRARVPLRDFQYEAGSVLSRLGLKERTEPGTVPVVMPRHLRDRRIVATGIDKVSADTGLTQISGEPTSP
jgi:hypothetical protein